MTRYFPAEPNGDALVTVIVPVFNTPPELIQRAVASVVAQTHTALELLIIDDGSTSEVCRFLDDVADGDRRIRVVHRVNGGVSAARNTGLDNASGDFIAYLDADDYLEPNFVGSALRAAQATNADVVFGGIRVLHESGSVIWRAGGPSATAPLLATDDLIVTACVLALSDSPSPQHSTNFLSATNVVSSLHKAEHARRYRFVKGLTHAEDRLYNVDLLLGSSRVAFCSDVWYVYDQTNDQGVTRTATPQTAAALSRTIHEFADLSSTLGQRRELSSPAREEILQAAADGVLNYLKVLSGVMAVVGARHANRRLLRSLLQAPSVHLAVARAGRSGWKDHIFASAAYRQHIRLLEFFGAIWVRSRGLGMSAADSATRSPREIL